MKKVLALQKGTYLKYAKIRDYYPNGDIVNALKIYFCFYLLLLTSLRENQSTYCSNVEKECRTIVNCWYTQFGIYIIFYYYIIYFSNLFPVLVYMAIVFLFFVVFLLFVRFSAIAWKLGQLNVLFFLTKQKVFFFFFLASVADSKHFFSLDFRSFPTTTTTRHAHAKAYKSLSLR